MYTSVKSVYKFAGFLCLLLIVFSYAKKEYSNPDFGKTFGTKAEKATNKLQSLKDQFGLCSNLCAQNVGFMQSIVFPEVMRYNSIKDGIETESLKTLYVQFGHEYANFSIGLFQMKPTFAIEVESKARKLLPDSIFNELQLEYSELDEESIRGKRVERLQDTEWQLVYLTAFICICNEIYKDRIFTTQKERLQWYATVYNAGFDKTDKYITQKIEQGNFYIAEGMPGNKFKYAAIAGWFFAHN